MLEDSARIICPHCGEPFDTVVDCSAGSQDYYEDCPVCCGSILLIISLDEDGSLLGINAHRENE